MVGVIRFAMPALAILGCAQPSRTDMPFHLTTSPAGAETRVALHADPHLKINARLPPALDLADGTRLRFVTGRLTADSAYYAEPPSALLVGRHGEVHGTLHVSVCREDERVCRSVTVEL